MKFTTTAPLNRILFSFFSLLPLYTVFAADASQSLFRSDRFGFIPKVAGSNFTVSARGSFAYRTLTIPRGGESEISDTTTTIATQDDNSEISVVQGKEIEVDVDVDRIDESAKDPTAAGVGEVVEFNSLEFEAFKHGDGSESDPDGLPSRFIRMQKGDREKAKAAFITTVNWRKEHGVNTILARPHPAFDVCKRIFPVYIPGRDLSNNVIVIQRVGMIDFDLAKRNNVTGDDLLMHYVYVVEYCWNILEPGPPDGVMTTVMDLKNVNFQTFRDAEIRKFLIKFVKTMSDHYPQRSHKTLIINAPSWVNMAYKLVKPLLRESTKKKITLLNGGEKQDKTLIEILGKESVPRDILINPDSIEGSEEGNKDGYDSQIETEMRLFVSKQSSIFHHIIMSMYVIYSHRYNNVIFFRYFSTKQCLKQLENNNMTMQSVEIENI